MTTNYLDKCLDLERWHTPATDYPQTQVGGYRIKRLPYPKGHYPMYGIDGHLFFKAVKPLPVTRLQERRGKRWYDWMVDDPPHERAMEIYGEQSQGNILCAGLGLGLVLHALNKNDRINSVTCVEISQDAIDLMTPNIKRLSKVEIVKADFFDYVRQNHRHFDGIIVDLWVANAKTKMGIFYHEVLPFALELRARHPDIPLTFHGFQSISDIKHTSPEMAREVAEMVRLIGGGVK